MPTLRWIGTLLVHLHERLPSKAQESVRLHIKRRVCEEEAEEGLGMFRVAQKVRKGGEIAKSDAGRTPLIVRHQKRERLGTLTGLSVLDRRLEQPVGVCIRAGIQSAVILWDR